MIQEITAEVTKQGGDKFYACIARELVGDTRLGGYGDTPRAAVEDFRSCCASERAEWAAAGSAFPDLRVTLDFDVPSLLGYYEVLNASAVARAAGISSSLMRQYTAGLKKPRPDRVHAIKETLRRIGGELARPVTL